MKWKSIVWGLLIGGLSGLLMVSLFYLGFRWLGLPFVPFEAFDWLARTLPGDLVTFGIDRLVSVIRSLDLGPTDVAAKRAEQTFALLLLPISGALLGAVLGLAGQNNPGTLTLFGGAGGGVLFLLVVVTGAGLGSTASPQFAIAWEAFVLVGVGALLGRALRALLWPVVPGEREGLDRRQFLYIVGAGSVTVMVTALGISLLDENGQEIPQTGQAVPTVGPGNTGGPAESPSQEALADRLQPAPGTRPELTPNPDFYRIDINTMPPGVNAGSWQLEVGGLVENPLALTLDDLRSREAHSQVITLECISNPIGGDLISTSLWTGVRLRDILDEAGLQDGAQEVYIESVDGFYESVPMDEAMDDRTLLVYEMNGEPLPQEHGFPLRIYIPNHFGMKQPKWITRMEVIDHEGAGYWVERGWDEEAIPPTTSVIDTIYREGRDTQSGVVPVGGIAFAGARGISRVEVQVDDGPWREAMLRTPALSPLTWVQWRYDWQAEQGQHTLRVRAYDGGGELQVVEPSRPHPDGATGVDSQGAFIPQA